MAKRLNNKQLLINAGLKILCEKPPEEVSMDEVAAIAGVTKPMVYYYFGSKVGFYQSLVDFVEESLAGIVDDCLQPGVTFRQALKKIIISRVNQAIEEPEFSNAVRIMAGNKVVCGAESRNRIVKLFSKLEPVLKKAIENGEVRRDSDLQLIMGMIHALIDGAIRVKGLDFLKNVKTEVFAERLVEMVFDGIGRGKRDSE